jgi:hypothetical protein
MILDIPAFLLDAVIKLSWGLYTLFINADPGRDNVAFGQLVVRKDESTVATCFTKNINFQPALNVFQVIRAVGECQTVSSC